MGRGEWLAICIRSGGEPIVGVTRSRAGKIVAIISAGRHHSQIIKQGFNLVYEGIKIAEAPIGSVTPEEFLGPDAAVTLENFFVVDGNVSLDELVFLCALARKAKPRHLLEIGTFDGNTALQLALNTPPDSRVLTLDLPPGAVGLSENDEHEVKYIASERRLQRRFLGTAVEHKIIQYYGNSLTYDFSTFAAEGRPEFIFIDAGHSYECVRNDSEKALSILAENGYIVWQDYGTCWPGVYQYLVELSHKKPLTHIAGTSLVVFQAKG